MLALIVSPCCGTPTFLKTTVDTTMSSWDTVCAAISVHTTNGTQHIDCDRDHDKCAGKYIKRQQDEEGWGPAVCMKRSSTGGVFGNSWDTTMEIIGIVSIVVTGGYLMYRACKWGWGTRTTASVGTGTAQTVAQPRPSFNQRREIKKNVGDFMTWYERDRAPTLRKLTPEQKIKYLQATKKIAKDVFKFQAYKPNLKLSVVVEEITNEDMLTHKRISNGIQNGDDESVVHSRRLMQADSPTPPAAEGMCVMLNEKLTVPNTEIHAKFSDAILEYTGERPADLHVRNNREMLKNGTTTDMCGFVNITMPEIPGGKMTYAHAACKTIASENITSYAFKVPVMTLGENNTWHIDPVWKTLTARHPRLGHPADARHHKNVLGWIHPEEKQIVAYPYLTFGNFMPYSPSDDAEGTLEYEGFLQLEKDLHAQKIAHPDRWAVSAGGGGGIFSRETMTTLHAITERVETVTTAANAGDYLSYSGEFLPSTIRDPQRVCAGIATSGAWGQHGFQGGNTSTPFVGGDYCGAIKPRTGLPSTKLMMETGFHMYAGLSDAMDAAVGDFVSSNARSPADWDWLGRLSLTVMSLKLRTLHYVWTFGAGMQPMPEYA